MIKSFILAAIFILTCSRVFAQTNNLIETSDIDLFWKVYDKVVNATDSVKSIQIIEEEYMNRGGAGLNAIKNYNVFGSPELYKMIKTQSGYLNSIRERTTDLRNHYTEYNAIFARFKKIYPTYFYPKVYFTIGAMLAGGFNKDDSCVVIGTEIAVGTKTSKNSSLNSYLKQYAAGNQGVTFILTHEIVHTQQTHGYLQNMNLTSICIMEGSADFIADILLGKKNSMPYSIYGRQHYSRLKQLFLKDKLTNAPDTLNKWIYNDAQYATLRPDLGYYIGYKICESYYSSMKDKKQAVSDILQINYDDKNSVMAFYNKSNFEMD